jgi:hypothetical protein
MSSKRGLIHTKLTSKGNTVIFEPKVASVLSYVDKEG